MVEFDILFGSGIDALGCLLDAADQLGVVERKGSWYSRGDLRFAQGRRPAIEFLRTNEGIAQEMERDVRRAVAAKVVAVKQASSQSAEEADEVAEYAGSSEEYDVE